MLVEQQQTEAFMESTYHLLEKLSIVLNQQIAQFLPRNISQPRLKTLIFQPGSSVWRPCCFALPSLHRERRRGFGGRQDRGHPMRHGIRLSHHLPCQVGLEVVAAASPSL